ncbi:MAG: hypothetical protein Q4B67_06000 [Eubacteriales bacterium]|nr:hypothetical protein [Eubacteriales bacterium]
MKKYIKLLILSLMLVLAAALTSFAATFSEFWYQDSAGWHVKDGNGKLVKNAWLCDNAVPSNGENVWYLIDANGLMYSAGLVQDGTGNYYSLEMNHDGYYGMLRYKSQSYTADGITVKLSLENSHNGSFAAIKNSEAVEALKAKYGLTKVNIDNSNIVYTADFLKNKTAPGPVKNDDFRASGSSVGESDILSSLKNSFSHDAATYFYFDPNEDSDKGSVITTARGIKLGSTKAEVKASYGNGDESGSVNAPSSQRIIEIAYAYDSVTVAAKCRSYITYYNSDRSAAILFAFDESDCVSYIFYYLV